MTTNSSDFGFFKPKIGFLLFVRKFDRIVIVFIAGIRYNVNKNDTRIGMNNHEEKMEYF